MDVGIDRYNNNWINEQQEYFGSYARMQFYYLDSLILFSTTRCLVPILKCAKQVGVDLRAQS